MRIYVAGKFEEKARVRDVMSRLQAAGHEITHDWTNEDASSYAGDALNQYLGECADLSYYGVMAADAVLVLDHPRGRGTLVELGLALAWGKAVFLVENPENVPCVFFHLDGVSRYGGIDQALAAVEDMAGLDQALRDGAEQAEAFRKSR